VLSQLPQEVMNLLMNSVVESYKISSFSHCVRVPRNNERFKTSSLADKVVVENKKKEKSKQLELL
jgi:hypothetical protein